MKDISNITKLILAIFVAIISQSAVAQKPYGIFDKAKGTLTLGYAARLPRGAVAIDEKALMSKFGEPETLEKVVIDKSFAGFRPKTCAEWFMNCESLTAIEGLRFLNTSATTSMRAMFYRCLKL